MSVCTSNTKCLPLKHYNYHITFAEFVQFYILFNSVFVCLYFHSSCWLTTQYGLIWAFVGPALCIIMVRKIISQVKLAVFTLQIVSTDTLYFITYMDTTNMVINEPSQ